MSYKDVEFILIVNRQDSLSFLVNFIKRNH